MSDADDELEEIRQRKREKLRESLDANGAESGTRAGAATPEEPIHVDGPGHFEEVVSAHDLLLVDFYADWCGPCEMLAPVVEELAAESPAAVAKVDTDAHGELAGRYGIQGLPTLLLFDGGEVAERVVGMQGKPQLQNLIRRHA